MSGFGLANFRDRLIIASIVDENHFPRISKTIHDGPDFFQKQFDAGVLVVNRNNQTDQGGGSSRANCFHFRS
jgi:hypothetical protein